MEQHQQSTIPKWYWAVTFFFLLWNIMGVASFFQHTFISDDTLMSLPIAERELYSSYPLWTTIAFAFAVFGGTLGTIGLLLKKKWSKTAFIVSLFALFPQMIHNLFFTKAKEVYGPGTEVMPILIVVGGVFLVWFSMMSIRKNWLK
ncbi:MAG: hypothetical protein COB60_04585 [Flavobacteriaceae bacterium]|nr:MAG: hypothetical protein COB60_04585 [Flavobacteriaceae bacterium]